MEAFHLCFLRQTATRTPLGAYPDNWYTVGYEHRDNDEALARSYPKQQDDNGLPYLR
ncbi:MAG: hypothetical protein Fur005_38830 [Roseiflexaceae bacterium]